MADIVVTLRIMPSSPEADLHSIETKAKKEIVHFCNSEEFKTNIQPIAFGLKALEILFIMDEKIGSTEALEEKIKHIEHVESVEVTDVRRTV